MHPGDPGESYSLEDFRALASSIFGQDQQAQLEARAQADKMWSESQSALDCWTHMPLPDMFALRNRGLIVLCTAPRELVADLKPRLRDVNIAVSAGTPGDATSGLGVIGDWHSCWASRTIGVASTGAVLGRHKVVHLPYISGPASSGSQLEWTSRRNIAHRIAFGTCGYVREVKSCVIDASELCSCFGTTGEEVEERYARAWDRDDDDDDDEIFYDANDEIAVDDPYE